MRSHAVRTLACLSLAVALLAGCHPDPLANVVGNFDDNLVDQNLDDVSAQPPAEFEYTAKADDFEDTKQSQAQRWYQPTSDENVLVTFQCDIAKDGSQSLSMLLHAENAKRERLNFQNILVKAGKDSPQAVDLSGNLYSSDVEVPGYLVRQAISRGALALRYQTTGMMIRMDTDMYASPPADAKIPVTDPGIQHVVSDCKRALAS